MNGRCCKCDPRQSMGTKSTRATWRILFRLFSGSMSDGPCHAINQESMEEHKGCAINGAIACFPTPVGGRSSAQKNATSYNYKPHIIATTTG